MRILLILSALLGMAASAIAQDYKAPRGADGIHPDLNGIWQALGSAHYDIEMHTTSHSLQLQRSSWAASLSKNTVSGCCRRRASGDGCGGWRENTLHRRGVS